MNFFNNKSKAFGLYDKALHYLHEHDIPYMILPKSKKTISFVVENCDTKKLVHFGLKIYQGKLILIIKRSFLEDKDDERLIISHIEDFTTKIYRAKYEEIK